MNAKLAKKIRQKARDNMPESWSVDTEYDPINVRQKQMYVLEQKEPIPYQTYTAKMKPCLRSFTKGLKKRARQDGATVASFG